MCIRDSSKGVAWLQITPRNADAAFKSARLGFTAGNLSQLDYVDALGQRTVIVFTSFKRNPSFAADTFPVSYTHLDVYKRQNSNSKISVLMPKWWARIPAR